MSRRNYFIFLILFIFFIISFLTNIIGPLVPEIIEDFNLSYLLAGFLPFSFFFAYALMSVPAGIMMEKLGGKNVTLIAFGVSLAGALLFAIVHTYIVAIISLFTIGIGMAMLQVVLYPLLKTTGGKENFAFNSILAQLSFGLASFISPVAYSELVSYIKEIRPEATSSVQNILDFIPQGLEWISLYWLFAILSIVMFVFLLLTPFPKLELSEDEKAGSKESYQFLLKKPLVWFYFFGIFFYVGTEQGVNNWASSYLFKYFGYDPQTIGAQTISRFWGLMTLGTLLALPALRLWDSRKVLIGCVLAAMVCLTAALFGSGDMALIAFPLIGFFISVVFAIVIDLGLNSLNNHPGAFAGILLSGIAGGAVWPLIVGFLGDIWGLKVALGLLYFSMTYIIIVGIYAKPLVSNKTVEWKKLLIFNDRK